MAKRPAPTLRVGALHLNPRPRSALLLLRPFPVGRFASLRFRPKNMAHHIFQSENELQNIPEAAPSSRSFSVSEKLALYGSSALSGVEHLRLVVGKDSLADALLRHFGSLKALSRASFRELRQFLTRRQAEAVMAALSMGNVAESEYALLSPLTNAEAIYKANLDMKGLHQEAAGILQLPGNWDDLIDEPSFAEEILTDSRVCALLDRGNDLDRFPPFPPRSIANSIPLGAYTYNKHFRLQ
jgi:hypothetical protein